MSAAPVFDALDRPPHLLLVDDDDRIRDLLKRFLTQAGARVSAAADAASARRLLSSMDFDLLILDVMMPIEDGFSLAESVRKNSKVPIILLTARGLAEDRIRGLSIGADDYVPKPFEPAELTLRINAILRRTVTQRGETRELVTFGPFSFNSSRGELQREGATVRLTEAEVAMLRVLAARPGEVVTREDLAKRTGQGLERSVDVQITRLRRKTETDPRAPVYLQTVRGVGYRLAVD
ncbi:response regulator [Vitreimonas flagellata]|uniref:response regulator n=1 Tax=Vitreimonas flagellata TaxID=2560861 RepID=UPI001075592B|nr:response regulator [Vitreimonas flagellata]